jgi:uncharacterized oxidoreductase
MNINNKTILITGGGAGIGLALAKQLSAKGNTVIITGRTEATLQKAVAEVSGLNYIVSDVTKPEDVAHIVKELTEKFNGLDIVINNAGHAHYYKLESATGIAAKAAEEMLTNYISIINLNEQLLPLLQKSNEAAIVTVSSIAGLVPNSTIPTYSASKAALHSYTQSLRYALSKNTSIKVFELMPPLVDTDFSAAIGGKANGIPPEEVADSLINGFENDIYEIHTGKTAVIYELSRTAPQDAFRAMNQDREI